MSHACRREVAFVAACCALAGCSDPPIMASDGGADASNTTDAAVTADAPLTTPDAEIPAACAGPVAEASLCLGDSSGHRGDRVAVDVHVVLPEGCAFTTQSTGKIVLSTEVGTFVGRTFNKPDCWSLMNDQGTASFWYATASAVGAGCPEMLAPGRLVTLELDIAAGAATGTHELHLQEAQVGDNLADCKGAGAISGHVTVLP